MVWEERNITEQAFVHRFCKQALLAFMKQVADRAEKRKRLYDCNLGANIPFVLLCNVSIWPNRMKCELTGFVNACEIYFRDFGIREISWKERNEIAAFFLDRMTSAFEAMVPIGDVKGHISYLDNKVVRYHLEYTCDSEEYRFMSSLYFRMRAALEEMDR